MHCSSVKNVFLISFLNLYRLVGFYIAREFNESVNFPAIYSTGQYKLDKRLDFVEILKK